MNGPTNIFKQSKEVNYPQTKDMKELKNVSNGEEFIPKKHKKIKFYHGTTKESWEEIQKEGVLWGRRYIVDSEGKIVKEVSRCTYLARNKREAMYYGDVLLEVEYDPFENKKENNYTKGCWQVRVYEPIQIENVKVLDLSYEVGTYFKLLGNKYYFFVDLQRMVKFKSPVVVKLTNLVNDKPCFGNLVSIGRTKFSPDYDTNNTIEFTEKDIIGEYTFKKGEMIPFVDLKKNV